MSGLPTLPPFPETAWVLAAREVIAKLQSAGFQACLVGGCVRDWLLGIQPHDADVATSAKPQEVTALFDHTREVGVQFGVVLVVSNGIAVEVATFRADGAYEDFRRPVDVKYGTLEEDSKRRDFTINALYYDPISTKLIDLHAGALDLRRRILKTVGPARQRFDEDALRLMRAVRFAVRFDLEIELNTRKAIIAKKANLDQISRERVGEELVKILTGPNPGNAMKLMDELGLWPHVVAEVESLKGVEQGKDKHPEGDVFIHTAKVLDQLPRDPEPELALAALLHDIAKPATRTVEGERIRFIGHQFLGASMADAICRRLKFSAAITQSVRALVEHHMDFMDAPKMRQTTLKRFIGRPDFHLHLELHRADSLGSCGDLSSYDYCVEQRALLAQEHGERLLPEPLIGGHDLIELGMKPGPAFSEILDSVMDEQIEGRIKTREQAIEFVLKLVKGS